jgi:signal transduction histidine kinase
MPRSDWQLPDPGGGAHEEIEASQRLMQIAEWELQQILLDIHDGPVQHMYAALSQIDLLRRALESPVEGEQAASADRLERVRHLIEAGLNDIRTFISAYRTPEFESGSVRSLLEALALQHESLTDTRVPLHVDDANITSAPLPLRIVVYRIMQEALANAYRHGGASTVTVNVGVDDTGPVKQLSLVIKDDGAGFDVAELPPGNHFGLAGMRDRAKMIGGSFRFESKVNGGTTVFVELPLA